MGWAPKDTAKQQSLERASMDELREAEGYPHGLEAMIRAIATDATPFLSIDSEAEDLVDRLFADHADRADAKRRPLSGPRNY